MKKSFRQIIVDKQNYDRLKKLGKAGESFNDVITKLIKANIARFDSHQTISNSE